MTEMAIPFPDNLVYARFRDQANVAYGYHSLFEFYTAFPYLSSNLRSLRICHKCLELYGSIKLDDGHRVEQRCLCSKHSEERWVTIQGGTRFHHDFNTEYEICYCCGLEIIPSGSKWSSFYCVDCIGVIHEFNKAVRQCLIPLGRHSLMNSISLDNKDITNARAISKFTDSVNVMGRGIDLVEQHRKAVAEKQVALLQLTDDAPAIDLLLKSNSLELRQIKTEAFFELLVTHTNLPIDRVKTLYEELIG